MAKTYSEQALLDIFGFSMIQEYVLACNLERKFPIMVVNR